MTFFNFSAKSTCPNCKKIHTGFRIPFSTFGTYTCIGCGAENHFKVVNEKGKVFLEVIDSIL